MPLPVPSLQSLAAGLPPEVADKLRSALAAQDEFNRRVSDFLTPTLVWQTPQLTNGWKNFSSTLVARYAQLSSGLVVLSGSVMAGTVSSAAFTLPVGLWPGQDVNLAVDASGGRNLVIKASGVVVPSSGTNAFFPIDCVFMPGAL